MREKAKEMPDDVITLQHQAIFTMIFQEYLVLIFQFEEMNIPFPRVYDLQRIDSENI